MDQFFMSSCLAANDECARRAATRRPFRKFHPAWIGVMGENHRAMFAVLRAAEQLASMGATVQPNQSSEEIDVTEFVRLGLLKLA
jgi:hypothetical protein